ncbi:unnamed protein product [Calypogeia fissa]
MDWTFLQGRFSDAEKDDSDEEEKWQPWYASFDTITEVESFVVDHPKSKPHVLLEWAKKYKACDLGKSTAARVNVNSAGNLGSLRWEHGFQTWLEGANRSHGQTHSSSVAVSCVLPPITKWSRSQHNRQNEYEVAHDVVEPASVMANLDNFICHPEVAQEALEEPCMGGLAVTNETVMLDVVTRTCGDPELTIVSSSMLAAGNNAM